MIIISLTPSSSSHSGPGTQVLTGTMTSDAAYVGHVYAARLIGTVTNNQDGTPSFPGLLVAILPVDQSRYELNIPHIWRSGDASVGQLNGLGGGSTFYVNFQSGAIDPDGTRYFGQDTYAWNTVQLEIYLQNETPAWFPPGPPGPRTWPCG